MKIHKSSNSIIISEKVKVTASASTKEIRDPDNKDKKIKKRFYSYRVAVPRILIDLIVRTKPNLDPNKFYVLPHTTGYYFTTPAHKLNNLPHNLLPIIDYGTSSFMSVTDKYYKFTLPKSDLFELLAVDEELNKLENIKEEKIYLYFKLYINPTKNKTILKFRFNRKYSSNRKIQFIKRRLHSSLSIGIYLRGCLSSSAFGHSPTLDSIYEIAKEPNEFFEEEDYRISFAADIKVATELNYSSEDIKKYNLITDYETLKFIDFDDIIEVNELKGIKASDLTKKSYYVFSTFNIITKLTSEEIFLISNLINWNQVNNDKEAWQQFIKVKNELTSRS